jgi:3-methylcrotonyl-CoA carboxylase alpha subunit
LAGEGAWLDLRADLGGARCDATAVWQASTRLGRVLTLFADGAAYPLSLVDLADVGDADDAAPSHLAAPMPGRIVQLLVEAGARVVRGQPLLVLEAMKMEHTVKAPADGTVRALRYAAGDLVEEGAELCDFEPADAEATGKP